MIKLYWKSGLIELTIHKLTTSWSWGFVLCFLTVLMFKEAKFYLNPGIRPRMYFMILQRLSR